MVSPVIVALSFLAACLVQGAGIVLPKQPAVHPKVSPRPVATPPPVAVSPLAGRFLAFQSNRPQTPGEGPCYRVYLYDCRTASVRLLPIPPPSRGAGQPSITADARYIAFTFGDYRLATIYDRQTSSLVTASSSSGCLPFPCKNAVSISRDGRYMVSSLPLQAGVVGRDICLYDLKAAVQIPLPGLNVTADDIDPCLSTDNRYIVFASARPPSPKPEHYHVYLYDRQTSSLAGLPGLSSADSIDQHPRFGALARDIVFHSDRAGGLGAADIYFYNRDTASLIPMPNLNSTANDYCPSMSSDGRFIAFHSDRPGGRGGFDICVYDRLTHSLVPLPDLNSSYDDSFPALN
jgi:Tol biopolymer transport system component